MTDSSVQNVELSETEGKLELKGMPPRFVDPEVEKQFREIEYQSSRHVRVGIYSAGVVAIAMTVLFSDVFVGQTPELKSFVFIGGIYFQLPLFLFAIWLSMNTRIRVRHASIAHLGLFYIIDMHAEGFRLLCAAHGNTFPGSAPFIGICLCVLTFGLPLRHCVIALLLFFVGAETADLTLVKGMAPDYASLGINGIFVIFTIIGAARADASSRKAFSRLALSEQRAYFDRLTGLSNRWGFETEADRIVRHAARERHPITLAVVDLDHFKPLNDFAGHAFGDFVLSQVGQCLNQQVRRPLDAVGRMGGEEFALLWYAPRKDFNLDIGDQIVTAVRNLRIQRPDQPGKHVTVSVGITTIFPKHKEDFDRALRIADECLYKAKAAGRDSCYYDTESLQAVHA